MVSFECIYEIYQCCWDFSLGESTFARQLSKKLHLAYIELDDLLWMDNWQETPDPVFFKKIQDAIVQAYTDPEYQGYVIDGNYSRTTHITWKEVDTIIWLDLPFSLNLYQSVRRAFSRAMSQQPFWKNSDNTESFRRMFSRDSIVLWMIKTHWKNRVKYMQMMTDPQYAHLHFVRLTSRKMLKTYLANI